MAAVNMQQGYTAVLWVLAVLGMEATALGECELTRLLQDKLQYEMRLQYMKHYFPINYMVQVQYEEVLRPSNITRLRNGTVSEVALRYLWFHVSSQAILRIHEVLPEKHPSWKYTQELCQLFDALGKEYSKYRQVLQPLQDLPILLLTLKATDNLSLLEVMCEAAEGMVPWLKPRQRTSCLWMDVFQQQYLSLLQPPSDVEAVVADLVKLIHSTGVESRRKAVRPKALLDNCLKVMRMLYGAPCQWEST